jgi:uncharacterized UPF0160 family protein
MSSPNMQLIRDALDTYAEQMKIDLKDNSFAEDIKGCDPPEAILQLLEKNRDEFKEYRDNNRKFIDCLNPVVKFVHAFSNVLGEATSLVSTLRLENRHDLLIFDSFSTMTRFHSNPQNSSS